MNNYCKREIKKLRKKIKKINELEKNISNLSDKELKKKTEYFKEKLKSGYTLDNILEEAFAVVREASKRVLNLRPYDVQIMGAIILHQGRAAEMKTGEGKTLSAILPAYLNALTEKGVHIVTVNDYLAKRDKEMMEPVFDFLGLSVGLNIHDITLEQKKEAYQKDITYGSNKEFVFDYLRDNLVNDKQNIVQRDLVFAIVDEADSILIDEAESPVIVSSNEKTNYIYDYAKANQFVRRLKGITIIKENFKNRKQRKLIKQYDYVVELKSKTVTLTEKGIMKAEEDYGLTNYNELNNIMTIHFIEQALIAHYIMKKDIDYVILEGKIFVIDKFTGRILKGKKFNNGLHQAIEAKEYLENTEEGKILAIITFQNYFRMYNKLSGMSGTLISAQKELQDIYRLDVVEIPCNKKIIRKDKKNKFFYTDEERNKAIIQEIKDTYKKGQPILVGTISIEASEIISKLLEKENIPYQLLNAKNLEKEAEIISKAGNIKRVTIATNMAGRGTDIKLQNEETRKLGGLKVIGVEINESKRIDDQLKGRSGRQGDIGESQFFISLEQELLKPYIKARKYINKTKLNKLVLKAQKRVEEIKYTYRKRNIKYDDIINYQRSIIYNQRKEILSTNNLQEICVKMIQKLIENYKSRDIRIIERIEKELGKDTKKIYENAIKKYKDQDKEIKLLYRKMMINVIDSRWMEHLNIIESLKEGIELRVYGRKRPIIEFNLEAFELFQNLNNKIIEDIGMNLIFMKKRM